MAFFFVRDTNQWRAVAKKVGPTRKKNYLLRKYIQKKLKKGNIYNNYLHELDAN
jgi:hypothetical protein